MDKKKVRVKFVVRGIRKGNKGAKDFDTCYDYREATFLCASRAEVSGKQYKSFHIVEVVELY